MNKPSILGAHPLFWETPVSIYIYTLDRSNGYRGTLSWLWLATFSRPLKGEADHDVRNGFLRFYSKTCRHDGPIWKNMVALIWGDLLHIYRGEICTNAKNLALWQNLGGVCQSSDIIKFCHCQIFAAHQQEHLFFLNGRFAHFFWLSAMLALAMLSPLLALLSGGPVSRWRRVSSPGLESIRSQNLNLTTHDFGYPC